MYTQRLLNISIMVGCLGADTTARPDAAAASSFRFPVLQLLLNISTK